MQHDGNAQERRNRHDRGRQQRQQRQQDGDLHGDAGGAAAFAAGESDTEERIGGPRRSCASEQQKQDGDDQGWTSGKGRSSLQARVSSSVQPPLWVATAIARSATRTRCSVCPGANGRDSTTFISCSGRLRLHWVNPLRRSHQSAPDSSVRVSAIAENCRTVSIYFLAW